MSTQRISGLLGRGSGWLPRATSAALALIVFLVLCPVKYHEMRQDMDSVWVATLNYAHQSGVVFGQDLVFTYGPLAYLALPMPFGANLEYGIVFQLGAWLALGAVLAWIVFRKRTSLVNLLVLAVCAPAGAQLFRASPTDGPDYFLEVMVVLLTAASLVGPAALYGAAVAVTAVLFLIKLSAGIGALGVILVFPLVLALTDRPRAWRLLSMAIVGTPILTAGLFCATGGSMSALLKYFRAGLEIMSGYSAAMSEEGPADALWAALTMLAGFAALAAVLYFRKDRAFPVSAAALPLLFLEFKHSFVRQDAHVEILFKLAPLVLAVALLFADLGLRGPWKGSRNILTMAALALLVFPWLYFERGHYYFHAFPWDSSESPFTALRNTADLVNFTALKQDLTDKSDLAFFPVKLHPQLLALLGNRSVAVFPMNPMYGAVNPIRLVPFPVLQGYVAYTPYLDARNAGLLNDPQSRPEYVLFEWARIDNRHPLLDCPQTALALYRNYQYEDMYGAVMVLHLRPHPLPVAMHLAGQTTMTVGCPFHLDGPPGSVVRIFLATSFAGRLAQFFFRIPTVNATLSGPGGRRVTYRIPPAVMGGGVPLDLMPADFADMRRLFEDGRTAAPFDTIALSGPGLADFMPNARVEIYESAR